MTTLYQDVDPVAFLTKSCGVEVSSWAVEPSSNPNPDPNYRVDDFFTVHIYYHDTYINVDRSGSFKLEKTSPYNRPKVQSDVYQFLLELEVDGNADGCAVDVVDDTCETFLQEISELNRKSLGMVVQINVGPEYEYDEDMDMTNRSMNLEEHVETYEEKKARAIQVETFLRTDNIIRPSKVDMGCLCSICLEEFDKSYNSGEKEVAILGCSHIFHGSCLVSWVLEEKDSCPMCRSNFLPC